MSFLVLAVGLAIFAAFTIAVRFHFRSDTTTARFVLLSLASSVNIFMFGRDLWLRHKEPVLLLVALALFLISAALFVWSLEASRSARLKLIFENDQPQAILRSGPYSRIRHPFYASYILFWSGCAIATLHPFNIAYAVLLVPLLWMAANDEEKAFRGSAHATAYADYRRSAGLFWPKF